MATIRLIPSTYYCSNSTYLSVTNPDNMYANCDSTTYATVTNSRSSTTSYYIYIRGFNFDDVPSNAVVSSFTIKFKAYESGVNTSTSYRPYLCNNTTTLTGSCSTISTSTQTLSFTGVTANWDTIKGYGSNFGIRINCRRASSNTTSYMYIYGAEIEVTYSLLTEYNVTVSCSNGTSTPTGTTAVEEGKSFTINATPNDGYVFSSMTVNGTSVTPTEATSSGLSNGVSLFHLDGNVTDELGNSTLTNGGSFSTTNKFGTNSIALSGSQYVTISLPQSYSPITVECWFNCTKDNASGSYPTLFSTNTTASSGGTYMHIDDGSYSTTTVCRSNAAGASGNNGGYGSTVISRNTWHHFAYCRSGSNHYFFVDGNLEYTVTQASPDDIETIYLGTLMKSSGVDTACYMTGYIDEILISSVCKWTASFTPPTSQYSTTSSTYYTYTVPSINSDTSISIVFVQQGSAGVAYIKLNGSYVQIGEIYKKVNGSWVLQTDLNNIFDENINYVLAT